MTKNKAPKKSPNWNIAATHFLTAGFVMPYLVVATSGIVLSLQGPVMQTAVWLFGLFLGVAYSASYIKKTYIISDAEAVSKLAAIYCAVFFGGLTVLAIIEPSSINTVGLIANWFITLDPYVYVIQGAASSALIYSSTKSFLSSK